MCPTTAMPATDDMAAGTIPPASYTQSPSFLDDFENYQKDLFSALGATTKAAQFLAPGELSFYKATADGFEKSLAQTSTSILALCNQLLGYAVTGSASTEAVPPFEDSDDVTDRFHLVVDASDNLLEKADVCLDLVTGRTKVNAEAGMKQSAAVIMQVASKNRTTRNVVHAQNIVRPQLSFEDKVDNSYSPWRPKIREKPNARRPLDNILPVTADSADGTVSLPHPYEFEIKNLEYPGHMFEARPEILYHPFDTSSYTWVDTAEQVEALAAQLDCVQEIAVDLEHHHYRSFQGFTCLMQISTRDEDFLIDTLALRSKLHLLNSSFTNPNIVKIFHGAENDIEWLQRDLGLYVVNLFDTYHASHLLEMPSHGLAFLLKHYCDFETNKAYQLADWRIRPLPTEMAKYARADTHFLLYIYDRMRNELINMSNQETLNLLRATLARSAETSLNTYVKEIYDAEGGEGLNGWRIALRRYGGAMRPEQFAVFCAVHAWRDHTAREEDESPSYVLPVHMLFTCADRCPTTQEAVLGCCNPVPPLVRIYASDIAMIVEDALFDAHKSMRKNEALYKKIKEDEAEWQRKRALGPTHKRFGEDERDVQANVSSAAQKPPVLVDALPHSKIFTSSPVKTPFANGTTVARVSISKHSIFGSLANGDDEDENSKARKMAEKIRKTLYLVAPTGIKRKRVEEADEANDKPAPAPAPVALKQGQTQPIPAEDRMDLDMTPPSSPPPAPKAAPTIEIDDELVKIVDVKRQKSKKNKKATEAKEVVAAEAPVASQPSSPTDAMAIKKAKKAKKNKAKQAPVEIKPFDYSTVKSVVSDNASTDKKAKKAQKANQSAQPAGAGAASSSSSAIEVITIESSDDDVNTVPEPKAKSKKRDAQQIQGMQQKIFDPYGATADVKQMYRWRSRPTFADMVQGKNFKFLRSGHQSAADNTRRHTTMTDIANWVDTLIQVVLIDGRVIMGTLKGYDQQNNLIMSNASERVFSGEEGVESVPLGLYIVRGEIV
ncbi:exosome nuclease subunit [Geranomyces michiganensis]|nr:exosome nuclease subunit [Geranomyces michiganensis]